MGHTQTRCLHIVLSIRALAHTVVLIAVAGRFDLASFALWPTLWSVPAYKVVVSNHHLQYVDRVENTERIRRGGDGAAA
jgi:hypothetical protein